MSKAKIEKLSDGNTSSREIAAILGVSPRYVRKVQQKYQFPRLPIGAQKGHRNHQYIAGRLIDLDGYALISTAPRLAEHRLVMEREIGRPLLPTEVVDHIDGLTLHNHPSNLRLFPSNAEHLRATITGKPHNVSASGRKRLRDPSRPPVDTYRLRKERGDVRLLAILRAALQLGIGSPYLSGSHQWLHKAGIALDRQALEQGLDQLLLRYEQDLAL